MAQCVAQSQRTGERCRRSATAGADTCSYHKPGPSPVKPTRRGVEPMGADGGQSGGPAFTTKMLSKRTCDDFEALFAAGTGWGRCGCLFALDAPRSTRGGTWAQQREANLCTMRGLVDQGRAHGILVYDDGEPVGWCQFVPKDELRFTDVATSGANWFITCFVVDPR